MFARSGFAIAVSVGMLVVVGCTHQGPKTKPLPVAISGVKGELYVDGKPAPDVVVVAVPADYVNDYTPETQVSLPGVRTDKEGKFFFNEKTSGIPVGDYTLVFRLDSDDPPTTLDLVAVEKKVDPVVAAFNGKFAVPANMPPVCKISVTGAPIDLGRIELSN